MRRARLIRDEYCEETRCTKHRRSRSFEQCHERQRLCAAHPRISARLATLCARSRGAGHGFGRADSRVVDQAMRHAVARAMPRRDVSREFAHEPPHERGDQ